jgi:hypothetical protein
MISVIIPVRNEYPQLVWTVYSFINDMPQDEQFEILIASNGPSEETRQWDQWFESGTLSKPGFTFSKFQKQGYMKILTYEEPMLPHVAITRSLKEAHGDVLVHSCGHIIIQRNTLPKLVKLARQPNVGYVHSPMLCIKDITNLENTWKCYGYGPMDIDGTGHGWSFQRISDEPYPWRGSGGGLSAIKVSDWLEVWGPGPPFVKGIGGVEFYLDLAMWMFGKSVWIHPDCLYYHFHPPRTPPEARRKYSWNMGTYYRNYLVAFYCLGGWEFMEARNKTFAYPQKPAVLEEVEKQCETQREYVLGKSKWTLEEVLTQKPWLT